MMARSTTAPAAMTLSFMTIESRTTAFGATYTPGEMTERETLPSTRQPFQQHVTAEQIDTHRGECAARARRLFFEVGDMRLVVERDHAEAVHVVRVDGANAEGHVGSVRGVEIGQG